MKQEKIIKDFHEKFGRIAFLEGATSYDIEDMRDLSDWLKTSNIEILEVFDLYNQPEELKKVIEFQADTLIMGTTGLRSQTSDLLLDGMKLAKDNSYSPKYIIDTFNNDYFESLADSFNCTYFSGLTVFCDEIFVGDDVF